jgi:hypothetical protein
VAINDEEEPNAIDKEKLEEERDKEEDEGDEQKKCLSSS